MNTKILRLSKKNYIKPSERVYNIDMDNLHFKNTDIYNMENFLFKYYPKNVKQILDTIPTYLSENLNIFNIECESKITEKCYEWFAADAIITDDFKLKILEINTNPGLKTPKEVPIELAHWIYDIVEGKNTFQNKSYTKIETKT